MASKDRERDFDNDRKYRNPAGWKQVKKALGGPKGITELADLFRELEAMIREDRTPVMCPRFALSVALAAFVTADAARQRELLGAYYAWCDRRERPWRKASPAAPVPEPVTEESLPAAEVPAVADGEFVELFRERRLFEVMTVDGYPKTGDGHEARLVLDLTNQRALFSEHVPEHERRVLLARAELSAARKAA